MTADEALERARKAINDPPAGDPYLAVARAIRRAALEERLTWCETIEATAKVRRELEALDD